MVDYNTWVVLISALFLGTGAGVIGVFLLLRRYALMSDAMSHATLPGIGTGFLVMTLSGANGRSFLALSAGALISAAIGVFCVHWLTDKTRLSRDVAIAVVLSVFFGFGVVLLTFIQTMPVAGKAGLETFLIGSGAAMVVRDGFMIAVGTVIALVGVALCHRPMTVIAFDRVFARAQGMQAPFFDAALLGITLLITVLGLQVVGLILIVALLIIPPVSARLWTNSVPVMLVLSAVFGGSSGAIGAFLSSLAADLPTGPMIVLVCFAVFSGSLVLSPVRGVLAVVVRMQWFRYEVHLKQGILALAHAQPVYEPLTKRILCQKRFITADGVPTAKGHQAAAYARLNEQRWRILRQSSDYALLARHDNGLQDLALILTRDQIRDLDRCLDPPKPVQ